MFLQNVITQLYDIGEIIAGSESVEALITEHMNYICDKVCREVNGTDLGVRKRKSKCDFSRSLLGTSFLIIYTF